MNSASKRPVRGGYAWLSPAAGLDVVGGLLLVFWLWLARASRSPAEFRVGLFVGLMVAAWAVVVWVWRAWSHLDSRACIRRIWIWAILFRLVGFYGEPILENDYFRYLWDGRMFAVTGNPYDKAPADYFGEAQVPENFEPILDNINYPDVPTIYGPVAQVVFLFSYWLGPGLLWPLKLGLILLDLLTLRLLFDLVKPRHVLLFAWCPLLIKETAFTAHSDSIGVFLLVWALHSFRYGRPGRTAVALALAVGAKVFAALLVPFLLWRLPRKYWAGFAAVLSALYLPFWLQGSTADWAGLSAFLRDWEFNSSIYGLLAGAWGGVPAKWICGALFLGGYLLLWRHWLRQKGATWPRGDLIFGVFFALSATVNPWYLLWLLPFVVATPTGAGLTAVGAVSLSYLSGFNLGDPALGGMHPLWVRLLEYGAIGLAAVGDWRLARRPRPVQPAALPKPASVSRNPAGSFLHHTLVVIPALNEAECIAATVAEWQHLGAAQVRVVDNGSADATAANARAAGAEVVGEPRRGYGAAAWRGWQETSASVEWILFSSADGSDRLSPAELANWQRRIDLGYDLLIGDRTALTDSRDQLKTCQQFGNRLACWLIALGWQRRFQDMGSLRLIRRSALADLRLQDRGFGWNVEMQVGAIERNLRIVEIPIHYRPRQAGHSKISGTLAGTARAGWGMLKMVARLWWRRGPGVRGERRAGFPVDTLLDRQRARL